jgi:hypothetical protein
MSVLGRRVAVLFARIAGGRTILDCGRAGAGKERRTSPVIVEEHSQL